jgi:RHS repeat-associated protein
MATTAELSENSHQGFEGIKAGLCLAAMEAKPNNATGMPVMFMAERHRIALSYYRARWYDPAAKRFITEDPIGLDGGINLYGYVGNNPLNLTDPYGHCDNIVCEWLNGFEIGVTIGIQAGVSGKWGIAKAKAQATLIGAEAKTGLGGGNAEAKIQTKASASASAGKASASASIGGQLSTSDGASASATAKVSVGPVQSSASATVDQNGLDMKALTGVVDPSKSADTDFKIGAGLNAIIGGEVSINFSQLGRSARRTGQELKELGGYLMGVFFPDPETLEREGPPNGFTPLRQFFPLR